MSAPYTSSFKVSTYWPELVNKKIQTIDSSLKEIQLSNRNGSLVAKGSIKREIRYLEFDGRARKTEDMVQFELVMGGSLPEPLSTLKAEIQQDSFIFQPRKLGDEYAVLEQQFQLAVREEKVNLFQSAGEVSVLAKVINSSGQGEQIIRLAVTFPEPRGRPKKFEGGVTFENGQLPPVIEGKIVGGIIYRTTANSLRELEINESFSLLLNPLQSLLPNQSLQVRGIASDIVWIPTEFTDQWFMEFKVDHKWFICEEKELTCSMNETDSGIRTRIPVFSTLECRSIAKEFSIKEPIPESADMKLDVSFLKRHFTKKGILVTAGIAITFYGISSQGVEVYYKNEFQFEELIPHSRDSDCGSDELEVLDQLIPGLLRKENQNGAMIITVVFEYVCKIYQRKTVFLSPGSDSDLLIHGSLLLDSASFALLGEERFKLRAKPIIIKNVRTVIEKIVPEARNGWLIANGEMFASVSYIDQENRFREDVFKIFFQKSMLWKRLQEEDQVELKPDLEYDSFTVGGNTLNYNYLLKLEAQLFREENIKINTALILEKRPSIDTISDPLTPQFIEKQSYITLEIEGEIPLKLGMPKEIAEGRTYIDHFRCRDALNAVFIEGVLGGEIEYWDEDGYLRREMVNYPFWKFLQHPCLGRTNESAWIPEIRNISFLPSRPWIWQRGTIKITVEIELKPPLSEGEMLR